MKGVIGFRYSYDPMRWLFGYSAIQCTLIMKILRCSKCGLGQVVKATTVWEGGTTFRTTAAPEEHELVLEAGKVGARL